MQDFLLTLVVIFMLFRIFGRSASPTKSKINFTQNNFNTAQKKPDGKVSVDFIPENKSVKYSTPKSGDYVDYEEVQ